MENSGPEIKDIARRFAYRLDESHWADVTLWSDSGRCNIDLSFGGITIRESQIYPRDLEDAARFIITLADYIRAQ